MKTLAKRCMALVASFVISIICVTAYAEPAQCMARSVGVKLLCISQKAHSSAVILMSSLLSKSRAIISMTGKARKLVSLSGAHALTQTLF